MHVVHLESNAIKYLAGLPRDIAKRITDKLTETQETPFRFFERLKGSPFFKLRIGNYRAIAEIDNEKIRIVFIGHRKNIYK